tara:strand:- start:79 stop:327 length:249 start_codon:yes stop_codon:yes gene_type:complete
VLLPRQQGEATGMPSHHRRQELPRFRPNGLEDVVILDRRIKNLKRKISVIKSKYPHLRNPDVRERYERLVAELKDLTDSNGV